MPLPNWEACEQLVPHIQACAAQLEQQSLAQVEATALFLQAGQYLRDRARYEQATPLYQRALASCEQQLGAGHPTTKIVRQNSTSLLQDFSPQNETNQGTVHDREKQGGQGLRQCTGATSGWAAEG
jgi:hypothetical protein